MRNEGFSTIVRAFSLNVIFLAKNSIDLVSEHYLVSIGVHASA